MYIYPQNYALCIGICIVVYIYTYTPPIYTSMHNAYFFCGIVVLKLVLLSSSEFQAKIAGTSLTIKLCFLSFSIRLEMVDWSKRVISCNSD